jgi:hypothetical protein
MNAEKRKRIRKKLGPRAPRTQRNDALQREVAILSQKLLQTDEPLTRKERSYAGLILETVVGQGLPGWFPKTDMRPIETAFDHGRIALGRAWLAKHHPDLLIKHLDEILRIAFEVKQNAIDSVPQDYQTEAMHLLPAWEATAEHQTIVTSLVDAVSVVRPKSISGK